MRSFAEPLPQEIIARQALGQSSWNHDLMLLSKLKDTQIHLWYAEETLGKGYSRNVLAMQMDTAAWERVGAAAANFSEILPKPDSDLAL